MKQNKEILTSGAIIDVDIKNEDDDLTPKTNLVATDNKPKEDINYDDYGKTKVRRKKIRFEFKES